MAVEIGGSQALGALVIALVAGCGGRATESGGAPEEGLGGSSPMGGAGGGDVGGGNAGPVARGGSGMVGGGGGSGATGGGSGPTVEGGGTGFASAGGAMTCSSPEACGGPVEGTWKVRDSCLRVSGDADVGALGLGCSRVPVEGSLTVSGTFSVSSVGAVADRTTTVGTLGMTILPECLQVGILTDCVSVGRPLRSLGYEAVTCAQAVDDCRCRGTVRQRGSMGLVSPVPAEQGNAELTPGGFSIHSSSGTTERYSSCTRGSALVVTPLGGEQGTITGVITLDRL